MGVGNWLRRVLGASAPEPSPAPRPSVQVGGRLRPARDPQVDEAVEVMLRNPEADQDQMVGLWGDCGFTPLVAWRAYQFLPIAFTHVVLRGSGVTFQPGYDLMDPDAGTHSRHRLADEPLYSAAVAAAEAWAAEGCTPQQLLPIFGRSAEWSVIRQLVGPDGRLDGVVLTEPLLMPFAGS